MNQRDGHSWPNEYLVRNGVPAVGHAAQSLGTSGSYSSAVPYTGGYLGLAGVGYSSPQNPIAYFNTGQANYRQFDNPAAAAGSRSWSGAVKETRDECESSNSYSPSNQSFQGSVHAPRQRPRRDMFDGPHQFLDKPIDILIAEEKDLPQLPANLFVDEQDVILSKVNDRLLQCTFDFVAKYQFPIPLEQDKRPVEVPADREWTEWVHLLKSLATKRRVLKHVLYHGQIKQLVTILENSMEMRHAAKHQSRPLKDDRNILQLISAGLQVAKILKDASAMEFLDQLYIQTEDTIRLRKVGGNALAEHGRLNPKW